MKYTGMPAGMWKIFKKPFRKALVTDLGYDAKKASVIMKKACPRYKEIIGKLPEFEKEDRFKTNILSCAMFVSVLLSVDRRPTLQEATDYYEHAMTTKATRWFCRKAGKTKFSEKDIQAQKKTASLRAGDRNPYSWNMEYLPYEDGSGYEARFTTCGICVLMREYGFGDLIPAMCHLDYTMSEMGGASEFVREYTLADGGPYCDCGYKKKKDGEGGGKIKMRVLVFGVGAIGSLIVHYLCKAGNDVTVVARSTYEELKENGLVIRHYLQRRTTVDHPRVISEADNTHYDIVFSVMQGQQLALLPTLTKVDTDLLVLVGNNMDTDICSRELKGQNVVYGFQGSAGHREGGMAVVGQLPVTELVIGGLHEPANPENVRRIQDALQVKGYKVTPVDSMYAYYMYHFAEVMPYCYLSYHTGCNLKKATKKEIQMVVKATKECFDYLKAQGIPVMPTGEDAYYEKGAKGTAMYLLYRLMGKTVLGRLMVSDHCENGVREMAYLDRRFEEYRTIHPGNEMPVWDEMRKWAVPAYLKEDPMGGRMKADYKNWVPKGMIYGFAAGTGVLATGYAVAAKKMKGSSAKLRIGTKAVLGAGAAACGAATLWSVLAYRKFSYDGKRQLSKQIIDGTADYITLPEGGVGLDVGCGSGALTIACAKKFPEARMVGIDRWGKEYASFSKTLCENNAAAEEVSNTSFEQGDAVHLDFEDETFDAVTSNYVYHNVVGADKQELLLETLRVLKKGGCFAIHDIMSKSRYGDMQEFAEKLRAMGYEEVKLIPTDDGLFMSKAEAAWMGLTGSTLLVGKK